MFLTVLLLSTRLGAVGCLPCAAKSVTLSVDSLFRLIDDNSRRVRLSLLRADEAAEGESVARSSRLPSVSASVSVGYLGNGWLTGRDFSGGMSVHNPHSNNNFALEAMQVIYSGGAVSGAIRMAELKSRMAALDVEQSRQEVRFAMLGRLIDLHCLHNRRRVLEENIALANRVIDNMRARYDEGVALLSDITRYELQLKNLQLQKEKNAEAIRTANYHMANALGFPPQTTEFVPELSPAGLSCSAETEDTWQQVAQASNLSLRKSEVDISISEISRRLTAAGRLPKLSLFAYGRFDSPIVTEVPVLNKNFMYWGFGVNLSFNISSLYTVNRRVRRAAVAEMESREARELGVENVQNDVKAAYEAYMTAFTELSAQEKSVELAVQNYAVVSDRFANGMALVTDMVDASNVRLSSAIGLENARTMLLFCYYRLKYVTNTL